MRKIYYSDKVDPRQYWDDIWQHVGNDPENVDVSTYPFYPTVNYIKKNDGLILECGCGSGRVVNYFYNNGFDIIGMDYSKTAVNIIKKAKPCAKVVCADALHLPFPNKYFRYLCAFGVYGAFEDRQSRRQFLWEAYRILDQNGTLIVSAAAYNTFYYLLHGIKQNNFIRRLFGKRPIFYCFGWYQFREKEIMKELVEAGFTVKDKVYTKVHQLFYDLFPFFRKNEKGFDRKDALRLERAGETVYPLNKTGKKTFSFINKKFPKLFAQSMVLIAVKRKQDSYALRTS